MADGYYLNPMRDAAGNDHLDICKLLYANGAQNDVRRRNGNGWTPFHMAANHGHLKVFLGDKENYESVDEIARWLTLHGALCADGSSEEIVTAHLYPTENCDDDDQSGISNSYDRLVEWAKGVTQTHSSLVAFLHGALPPAPDTVQSRTLQCLCGHPGVRKHIGDFVGLEVTKGKHLRILRNVVDVLPSLIKPCPWRGNGPGCSSSCRCQGTYAGN